MELVFSLVGVFFAVAMLVGLATSVALSPAGADRRRLRELAGSPQGEAVELEADATLDPALRRLSATLPKSPKGLSRLRRQLMAAGWYDLSAAVYFSTAKLVLPVALAVAVVMTLGVTDGWLLALVALPIGYLLPDLYLARRVASWSKQIRHGLPDALDLMIVCIEAGSSLDQSIVKTSEELVVSHPALASELRIINTEIRVGKPRMEAFQNFARRTQVEDVRALVAMLMQTDRFGTSITQALRTHAETARTKRRQIAEEKAGKVGVKLVFPLVLCIFPAVYVVCIGPVVVAIYRAFF